MIRQLGLRGSVSRPTSHDGAVTCRTGATVVPDQQMPDENVDSSVALPAEFGVFLNRQISRPPNSLRFEQGRRGIASQPVEFRALRVRSHSAHYHLPTRVPQRYLGTIREVGFATGARVAPVGENRSSGILGVWRGTQEVRERSAKPLCVGSIPTRASKIPLCFLRLAALRANLCLSCTLYEGVGDYDDRRTLPPKHGPPAVFPKFSPLLSKHIGQRETILYKPEARA
jgi:hypothetical protein